MKTLIFILVLSSFISCAPTQEMVDYTPPTLVSMVPLPELPPLHPVVKKVTIALFIDSIGSVQKVHFVKGSLNTRWDSLAALRIREWKFMPAVQNGKPISLWFRYQLELQYFEPKIFTLAEIVCSSKELADSLYTILTTNNNFEELARRFSISETRFKGGVLGDVNIYDYPKSIWSILEKLEPGKVSPPLQRGTFYVIFKRLRTHNL